MNNSTMSTNNLTPKLTKFSKILNILGQGNKEKDEKSGFQSRLDLS